MTPLEIAQQYFNAWNARDAVAVLATFVPAGTYQDPTSGGPLGGDAFLSYMNGLIAAFPDLSFEILSAGLAAPGLVSAQWIMRGTNSGSLNGLPPTNKKIELPGADFIRVVDGKIHSVIGYFDSRVIPDQLGLQVVVQPTEIGPYAFGTASRTFVGNKARPGAVSITMLETRTPEELAAVTTTSRAIAQELLAVPGFIGLTAITIGPRLMTVAAWEHPSDPVQVLRSDGAHNDAVKMFHGNQVASGGYTSVWTPLRINTLWTRCSCGKMADSSKPTCTCGATLPERLPYW